MDLSTLQHLFTNHKESFLFGRYIYNDDILPLIKKHQEKFYVEEIGTSVLGEKIQAIKIGAGPKKIFMWSQMHGNESTTTKAVFDLCNVFANSTSDEVKTILNGCTIAIIPMLNPDGAKAYTRTNANNKDLNRDAQDLTQPESRALRNFFERFQPDFCFNLHGQRTIFSAGKNNYPSTVSFLAPAQDPECSITNTRKKAMDIIVKMNDILQQQIPNQVGIYDDAFNLNCVGDTFQNLNVPTILFEAGHYTNDYQREKTREFIFQSFFVALNYMASGDIAGNNYGLYSKIPLNHKCFYDIIIRNAVVKNHKMDVAIQYQEKLILNTIEFLPIVEKISCLDEFFGHKEVDANGNRVLTINAKEVHDGYENDFVLINNEKFSLKV